MMFYVCFVIAIIWVVLAIRYCWKEMKSSEKFRTVSTSETGFTLLIISIICILILLIPWFRYCWKPEMGFIRWLLSPPYLFLRIMQTFSLDADYEEVMLVAELAEKSGVCKGFLSFYTATMFWVSALIPFFGAWTIVGLFGNIIGYRLVTSRFCPCKEYYVFNGVGSKNIDLAESIWEAKKKNGEKAVFLFCNISETPDDKVLSTIRRIKGKYSDERPAALLKLISYDSGKASEEPQNESKEKKLKSIRYFMLENEDVNFDDAIMVLKTAKDFKKKDAKRVKIDILLHDNELDNILDAQEKNGIFVTILDVERLYAQELYARWPLFSGLGIDGKEINLAILGKGSVAEELLLNAIWMGTINSASLKITYIGEDAKTLERKLKMSCPGMFNSAEAGGEKLTPSFVKIGKDEDPDLDTMDITQANYVIVAGDDDERNIRTAMWYKTWVARRMPVTKQQPFIAVLVNDAEKAEQAKQLKVQESQEPYDFHVFGTDKEIFSARYLLHSKLLESLFQVQLSYNCNDMGRKPTEEEEASTWDQLNESVYNFRSSEASALYIVNRLYDSSAIETQMRQETGASRNASTTFSGSAQAEYWYKALYSNEVGAGSDKLNALIDTYNRLLEDEKMVQKLAKAEHRRWNAYMVSNGWITMTEEETKKWMETRGSKEHKDYLRLRHACIVPWDDLDSVSELKGRAPDFFKNADRGIVTGVTNFIIRDK